jgi:hypothetical protein
LFQAWIEASGGPDISSPACLRSGAPLGLTVPVTCHGSFHRVEYTKPPHTINDILTPDGEWSNYRSAEEDIRTCAGLLQHMLDNKWAQSFDTKQDLLRHLNATEFTLSRLALIAKTKPDGTTKHRLVWDLLRSRVNSFVHQGERIVFHSSGELPEATLEAFAWLFGIDISDAFHQIPLNNSEKRFAVAFIDNKFWVFSRLVFDSGSAPTAW